jgi:hypothetical protein
MDFLLLLLLLTEKHGMRTFEKKLLRKILGLREGKVRGKISE